MADEHDPMDPVYRETGLHRGEAKILVGNDKRYAGASVYRDAGPFIRLGVNEQSRSASEEGAVYLWPEEAHALGEWLVANTSPAKPENADAELAEVLTRIADQGSPHARLLREAATRLCRRSANEFLPPPGWENAEVIARSDPPRVCAYLWNEAANYANGNGEGATVREAFEAALANVIVPE